MARVALAVALVLVVTACSSSKHSGTTTATTTGPIKSPIVVKTPLSNTQWRSPITVKGTSSLHGKLTVEVQDAAGKQLGSKDTTATDGHFAVEVAVHGREASARRRGGSRPEQGAFGRDLGHVDALAP